MFDIGSAKKHKNKIVAGLRRAQPSRSHSHYLVYPHNILYYAFEGMVGSRSTGDQCAF
jgi:hypothetical protein